MRKTINAALLASAVFAVPHLASAQTAAPAAPAAPAEAKDEGLKLGIFDVSGYADASYNRLSRRALFTSGAQSRVFDIEQSAFALRQAAVKFDYSPQQGLGGVLNFTAGKDADLIAAYKTDPSNGKGCNVVTGLNADGSKCDRDRFDITQAYLQYKTGSWHLMGGKFVTLAGAEVIWSPANPNYSRSILFGYAIPFTHTGLRAHYTVNDTLTVQMGVNQGWDDIKDTNSSKAYELGLMFNPSKMVALTAMFHGGKERVGGLVNTGAEGNRNLFDSVLTINATDKLTFIFNYDYATQDGTAGLVPSGASKAKWSGLAGYANYAFSDHWKLSFRAEYFDDKDGYRTGIVQKWKEGTLTVAWLPTKPIEVRAEVRRDRSNVASFLDRDGVTGRNNNSSYGLQFLYKF